MKTEIQSGPQSHAALRALLRLCDMATERADVAMMRDVHTIAWDKEYDAPALPGYVDGLLERLESSDPHYHIHDDETMESDRKQIEAQIYGDFDEAMSALEHDLMYIDQTIKHPGFASDIFVPKWFTSDQQTIWNKLRQVLDAYRQASDQDHVSAADEARRQLRQFQQQSYGPLIPTMVVAYIKRSGTSAEGVSVRLIWSKDGVEVHGSKEVCAALEIYLRQQAPISEEDFTDSILPERIGDYTFGGASSTKSFAFELGLLY